MVPIQVRTLVNSHYYQTRYVYYLDVLNEKVWKADETVYTEGFCSGAPLDTGIYQCHVMETLLAIPDTPQMFLTRRAFQELVFTNPIPLAPLCRLTQLNSLGNGLDVSGLLKLARHRNEFSMICDRCYYALPDSVTSTYEFLRDVVSQRAIVPVYSKSIYTLYPKYWRAYFRHVVDERSPFHAREVFLTDIEYRPINPGHPNNSEGSEIHFSNNDEDIICLIHITTHPRRDHLRHGRYVAMIELGPYTMRLCGCNKRFCVMQPCHSPGTNDVDLVDNLVQIVGNADVDRGQFTIDTLPFDLIGFQRFIHGYVLDQGSYTDIDARSDALDIYNLDED